MEFLEFKGKTKDEALMQASVELGVPSTDLEYVVISDEKKKLLGIGSKSCIIQARIKKTFLDDVKEYLDSLFKAMDIQTEIQMDFDEEVNVLSINLEGPEMGILIGKRGQTLDALQYIITLAIKKKSESLIRVKLDTENYRARRKETLENLAKNIAFKVKRSKRSFALEPMNPYERRIIHSKVAEIEGVYSNSIGEEPYRKVVISASQPHRDNNRRNDRKGGRRKGNGANRSYKQSTGFSTSFEREYKRSQTAVENTASDAGEFSKEAVETERNATLYGKIEL